MVAMLGRFINMKMSLLLLQQPMGSRVLHFHPDVWVDTQDPSALLVKLALTNLIMDMLCANLVKTNL